MQESFAELLSDQLSRDQVAMSTLPKAVLITLSEYLTAPSWSESRKALERHPELLSPLAEDAAIELEDQLTDTSAKRAVALRRRHLHRCLEVGVQQAYQERASRLLSAANEDLSRFEEVGEPLDLNWAITFFEDAARLSADDVAVHSDILTNLGYALRERYLYVSHSEADLARAIQVLEQSVRESPPGAPHQDLSLANLGLSLRDRYRASKDRADLDGAIELLDRSLAATPKDSPHAPERYSELGGALANRFAERGHGDDLDHSIRAYEHAVQLARLASPIHLWLAFSNDLAVALMRHYLLVGDISDLTRALEIAEPALDTSSHEHVTGRGETIPTSGVGVPPPIPGDPVLMVTVGSLLKLRYERFEETADLRRAILLADAAVVAFADSADDQVQALALLGMALRARFKTPPAEPDDLERSIEMLERAVHIAEIHAREATVLCAGNLGISLRERYRVGHRDEDLDAAIKRFEQVVRLVPAGAPEEPRVLKNLANVLELRYDRSATQEDKDAATNMYQRAIAAGLRTSVEIALGASRDWLHWAFARKDWQAVVTAYESAELAQRSLIERQLLRQEKESWLKETQGLAARAAYALVKLGRQEDALLTIEGGLAQLWRSVHELDATALGQLKSIRPDLAARYLDAIHRVQYTSTARLIGIPLSADLKAVAFDPVHDAATAARAELEAIVAAIRELPGYGEFLLPPSASERSADVHAATVHAPAVYLVATEAGGMALIVSNVLAEVLARSIDADERFESSVTSLPCLVLAIDLPGLSLSALRDCMSGRNDQPDLGSYLADLNAWRADLTSEITQARWWATLDNTGQWMWDVAMGPILKVLGDVPQVTVVPTGALRLLPFHAAWSKDATRPGGRLYALDQTVIQYAPCLRVLAASYARARVGGRESLLVVQEPRPVRLRPLPNAGLEAQAAAVSFAPHSEIVSHESATHDAVLARLPHFSFVHFACHGSSDPVSPLDSCLTMANDVPLTLRDLLLLRLAPGRLAIVSACETGIPGNDLPDEAMSFGAGLLEAGFAGVITTGWALADDSAAMLMMRFYDFWKRDGYGLPEALRGAQQWLRDTTNQQKVDYLSCVAQRFGDDAARDVEALRARIAKFPESKHGYAHPVYWATFSYTGA